MAARIVTRWPKEAITRSSEQSSIARAGNAGLGSDTLLTWLIAPAETGIG